MCIQGKIAWINVTGGRIDEIHTNAIMDKITIDDVDKITIYEKHPAFIIIVITGGWPWYFYVWGPFTEESDTVGICVRVSNSNALCFVEEYSDAVVIEITGINGNKRG